MIKNKQREEIFLLMYYCGFSYYDAHNLPIQEREWFIKRAEKEIKKNQDQDIKVEVKIDLDKNKKELIEALTKNENSSMIKSGN